MFKDGALLGYEAAFDGFGNKITERLPDSTLKVYAYDSLNLMTKDSNATENLVTRYEFTPKGHLQQQNNPDGTTESFLYDAEGQLLRRSVSGRMSGRRSQFNSSVAPSEAWPDLGF